MAVLRFTTMDHGAQSVMIAGISMMLMWYVVSLASSVHPGLLMAQCTVKGLKQHGWMTSFVKEERHRYYYVLTMDGDLRTVAIVRMQVSSVKQFV